MPYYLLLVVHFAVDRRRLHQAMLAGRSEKCTREAIGNGNVHAKNAGNDETALAGCHPTTPASRPARTRSPSKPSPTSRHRTHPNMQRTALLYGLPARVSSHHAGRLILVPREDPRLSAPAWIYCGRREARHGGRQPAPCLAGQPAPRPRLTPPAPASRTAGSGRGTEGRGVEEMGGAGLGPRVTPGAEHPCPARPHQAEHKHRTQFSPVSYPRPGTSRFLPYSRLLPPPSPRFHRPLPLSTMGRSPACHRIGTPDRFSGLAALTFGRPCWRWSLFDAADTSRTAHPLSAGAL